MDENGYDIAAWQSGGPFVFEMVQVSISGDVCTMVLTAKQYNRVVQLTKDAVDILLNTLVKQFKLRLEVDSEQH